jgi:hypothetical protein
VELSDSLAFRSRRWPTVSASRGFFAVALNIVQYAQLHEDGKVEASDEIRRRKGLDRDDGSG